MDESLQAYSIHNAMIFDTWRKETVGGKDYLVVRGVPLVEGVLNGRFVASDQFGAFVKDWDGVPVVVRHPKTNGGSARNPLVDVPIVGRFFNAQLDGTRLVGEFWLEENELNTPEGETIKTRIKAHLPVEVSTGYYAESVPKVGTWNGKDYSLIDQNLHPDHISILPDDVGACSLSDGCGLNRNCQMSNFDNTPKQNVTGLTGKAADLWEEVYQSYKDKGMSEGECAKRAWGAVKGAYHKQDGEWVKKNELSELINAIEVFVNSHEPSTSDLDISPDEAVGLATLVAFVSD